MNLLPVKRALISVSDKTGVLELATALVNLDVEIISTGGTSQLLQKAGVTHRTVEEITGMPALLGDRVKTLHPRIHGGILGKRDDHAKEAKEAGIGWIDLVIVNFYPIHEAKRLNNWDEIVEYIDIGGPTLVRAAAKNFAWVAVVTDPGDYLTLLKRLQNDGGLSQEIRQQLAQKAFALTSHYDALVHQFFAQTDHDTPSQLPLKLEKKADLRYGENPHQTAALYQFAGFTRGIGAAKQHQGKALSYNNYLDSEAAYQCLREFKDPACVIIKHMNPCGLACAPRIEQAFADAYAGDQGAAFGGIVAINRPCTADLAKSLTASFFEVIIAPDFAPETLPIFAGKPNLRLLALPPEDQEQWELRFIEGGALWQERNQHELSASDLTVVTTRKPTKEEIASLLFAWRAIKHIKSNAILIATGTRTLGIGSGQVSRVDAVISALRKAGSSLSHAVLASDAFFPFRDSIDLIAETGLKAIIQPGGSLRDAEVIKACNEHDIAMVFTGHRCFKH